MGKPIMKAINILLAASVMSFVPPAEAQVYSTLPNGTMGYASTPNPISPDCVAPQVWTFSNGHYSCQNPPPSLPSGNPGPPPANDPANLCNAVFAAAGYSGGFNDGEFSLSGGYWVGYTPLGGTTGPVYDNGSYTTNAYMGYCQVNPTTGQVVSWNAGQQISAGGN
jgi:hypothetical protein